MKNTHTLIAALRKILASAESYPYFHVSNFPETPRLPENAYKGGDPTGIYLGIKGKKYTTKSFPWDQKSYYWDAKLKAGVKLYNMASWTSSDFFKFLHLGAIKENDIVSYMKKHPSDWDLDGLKEAKDTARWLESYAIKYPSSSYQLLKDYIGNGDDLAILFKKAGYGGVIDEEGDHIYDIETEPQLVIFKPSDIEFSQRKDMDATLLKTIIGHRLVASRTVYNGSDKLVLDKKIIDDFNSLGVWFSTDPDYAKRFGKLRKFSLEDGNFLEMEGSGSILRFLYFSEVYEDVFGPYSNKFAKDLYLGRKLGSWLDASDEDAEDSFEEEYDLALDELKNLKTSSSDIEERIRVSVGFYAPYLTALKKYLKGKGYDGFYFSNLDGHKHDAWVVFEPSRFVKEHKLV
jgi:hypothetical protein